MLGARLALAARLAPSVTGYAQQRSLSCYQLESRGLLRVQGPDTETFLQGLITNDVQRMRSEDRRALYSHLLNVQGRTLFDVILYRLCGSPEEELDVLLECDSSVLDSIQKHLKVYKIRRKVSLVPCSDLTLWAVLSDDPSEDVPGAFQSCVGPATILTPDPRVAAMGWRLITSKDQSLPETQKIGSIKDYHKYRYRKGVPEGVSDLPPGVALPLESNLEYMHGISFSKGCYIGQELTARTHYTGVIRKRLVPVQLSQPLPSGVEAIPSGADISTGSGKSAGKYRAGEEDTGLALLRLAHMNDGLHVKISNATISLSTALPEWWPQTAKCELSSL